MNLWRILTRTLHLEAIDNQISIEDLDDIINSIPCFATYIKNTVRYLLKIDNKSCLSYILALALKFPMEMTETIIGIY